MLKDFISSALIIDDSKEEIEKLKEFLEGEDIWVKHYTPAEIETLTKSQQPFNNRKLIFLDLYLNDRENIENNIARIRSYFSGIIGNDFGTYGIVLWTKHTDEFNSFVERIYKTANKYTPPLFVVPLEKNQFLAKGDFSRVLEKLEEKLSNDLASSFFVEWNKAVKKGSDNTISTLYSLFETNKNKQKYLEAVLFKLACNYTGIPVNITQTDNSEGAKEIVKESLKMVNPFLQMDLVKSLMGSLQVEISNSYKNIEHLFTNPVNLVYEPSDEKTHIFSKLNSLLLLDFHNLLQEIVLPGNIYEVLENNNPIYINHFYSKQNEIIIDEHIDFKDMAKDETGNVFETPKNIKRIVIEITPPCDFAGNKKQLQSRIIGGIILEYSNKLKEKYFKGDGFYSFLCPISFNGFEKPQMIIFDFYKFQTINEENLRNIDKYKIIAKAKDRLFADILQKLSAHTARLGIAILYP